MNLELSRFAEIPLACFLKIARRFAGVVLLRLAPYESPTNKTKRRDYPARHGREHTRELCFLGIRAIALLPFVA